HLCKRARLRNYGGDMDDSEKAAKEYILHLGYKETEVRYEPPPEGQAGPDFVVNGRVAVEVTRLEPHVGLSAEGKRLGEEGASIPVLKTVQQILSSFGPPKAGFSWFVNVDFSLPAPSKREVEREIRRHLTEFQNGAVQKPTRIQVFDNFTIELFRAGKLLSNYFQMGPGTTTTLAI